MAYHSPSDLATALDIASQNSGVVIAGGTDVYPSAKQGEHPAFFLDVTRIQGLHGISFENGVLRFGAATTWSQIAHAELPPAFDALKQAALEVGSIQIQNAGTIAGNICNASPAADGVPPLLALNAQVELASAARGVRVLDLADFLLGMRKTALAKDELVTAIVIPPVPKAARSAFEKLGSRRYLVISIAMVAATITCDESDQISDARVAVGACSPVAQRLTLLERDLVGKRTGDIEVGVHHLAPLSPISDVRASGPYRLDVVAEQIKRAIVRALA